MPRRLLQTSGGLNFVDALIDERADLPFLQRLRYRSLAYRRPDVIETKSAARLMTSDELNERERVVLNWVATGKSDWQVAQLLSVSPKTVNYHVENAKRKLGATTRIQAVVEAVRLGLIDGRGEE